MCGDHWLLLDEGSKSVARRNDQHGRRRVEVVRASTILMMMIIIVVGGGITITVSFDFVSMICGLLPLDH